MGRLLRIGAAIVFAAVFVAFPLQAAAADLRQGSDVTVGSAQSINDDLYAAAGTVTVDGTINGSVIVVAGTLTVAGTVSRDVIVAGGTVTIGGNVGGSVRAAGGTITVNGTVAQDVVVAGGTINLASGARVGRDLILAAGNASVSAPIERNVVMGSGTLTLRSRVGGNVTGRVDHLTLDGAQVGGNLDYTSANEVQLQNGARVAGTTTRQQPPARNPTNGFIGWLRALVGIVALGLLFVFLLPRLSVRSIDTLRADPWESLGIGAAILVVTPVVALVVFLVGLFIGFWWIGALVIPFWLLLLALGYVVSAFLLGRIAFAQVGWGSYHDALALVAGLVILAIVTVIPILGWLIGLAAVVFGAGALAVAGGRWATRARAAGAL